MVLENESLLEVINYKGGAYITEISGLIKRGPGEDTATGTIWEPKGGFSPDTESALMLNSHIVTVREKKKSVVYKLLTLWHFVTAAQRD